MPQRAIPRENDRGCIPAHGALVRTLTYARRDQSGSNAPRLEKPGIFFRHRASYREAPRTTGIFRRVAGQREAPRLC